MGRSTLKRSRSLTYFLAGIGRRWFISFRFLAQVSAQAGFGFGKVATRGEHGLGGAVAGRKIVGDLSGGFGEERVELGKVTLGGEGFGEDGVAIGARGVDCDGGMGRFSGGCPVYAVFGIEAGEGDADLVVGGRGFDGMAERLLFAGGVVLELGDAGLSEEALSDIYVRDSLSDGLGLFAVATDDAGGDEVVLEEIAAGLNVIGIERDGGGDFLAEATGGG